MRYILAALLAGGLVFAFYQGLLETGVFHDASTPDGYYGKYVDYDLDLLRSEDGYLRLTGWQRNIGERDLRNIRVTIILPDHDGEPTEVDTVRIGSLRAGSESQIDTNVEWPEEFPVEKARRFLHEITCEFADEDPAG